jgi:hypothetical protein
MAKLTNSYDNCTLLNLAYGPNGRGPFVIRQDGYVPGSETFKENRYLLRKDGAWVLNLAAFMLPEKEKEQFIFTSSAEAMTLLQGLASDPIVEGDLPEGRSREEIEVAAQSTITGLWGRIRAAQASKITP